MSPSSPCALRLIAKEELAPPAENRGDLARFVGASPAGARRPMSGALPEVPPPRVRGAARVVAVRGRIIGNLLDTGSANDTSSRSNSTGGFRYIRADDSADKLGR